MTQPPQPPNEPPNSDEPQGQSPDQPQGQSSAQPPAGPPAGSPAGAPAAPPAGGFGAPQDPPPGGFGEPTPPPADPFTKQPPPAAPPTPPVGGYGSPPTPPAGGYGTPQPGYPTPPAPQPNGYGYPQAAQPGYGYPQGAPGQPGGYPGQPGQPGYPAQQGQPGYPGGQPGYGYPTQPMYGAPQPGPGGDGNGGKKFSTQMQIIVAAAVAVVLIIGAAVVYSVTKDDGDKGNQASTSSGSTGGEGKGGEGKDSEGKGGEGGLAGGTEKAPGNTNSQVAFQVLQPEVTQVTSVKGSWLTDKAYVKSGASEVVGYDRDKGTKLWSVPVAGEVCGASRHMTKDHRTAILFKEGKPTAEKKYPACNQVGVVDLAAGKLLWSKSVTSATGGDRPVQFDEVTISGTTVAAGGTSGGAAFKLEDGAELWKPKVDGNRCYDTGYAGGEALAVVRKCGSYDSPQLSVQMLNPATGAPLSSFDMPAGVDYASVVSTKPLVVAANVGDTAGDGSGISDFFSIDAATGKLIVRISADAEKYAARCRTTDVESCQGLAVGNNRLYLPTEDHDGTGEYGKTNEIVAFDLATGKLLGGRADAGDRYSLTPLRMDGTSVIAYKRPPYDKGGQIVSIDGETFKQTLLMENPADETVRRAETSFSIDHSEVLYGEGRFYLAKQLISERRDSQADEKLYLSLAFRTG
ncbi:PQQ-binding-like beta-propeller repeat protein [Streptomyces bacillaris]|uniref:outer membrane protein assembly factor BamB family protein n=1 Tax=Streptomyces TaxID=1883 RepID=UPI0036374519